MIGKPIEGYSDEQKQKIRDAFMERNPDLKPKLIWIEKNRIRHQNKMQKIAKMIEMRECGYTLAEIGHVFSITRQRVDQIIKEHSK